MHPYSSIPPNIEKRIVCISDNFVLAAQISSYFNDNDMYFSVLELPRFLREDWTNELIKLNNVLSRIKADRIIFAGVSNELITLIKNQLRISERKYLYINKKSEIKKIDNFTKQVFRGTIECEPDSLKITYCLLEAKRKKLKLNVTSSARYSPTISQESKHCVYFDSVENINPVLVANYAFSINADIQFLDLNLEYDSREISSIISDSQGNSERGTTARGLSAEIELEIKSCIGDIRSYEFATFFTKAIHYGFFCPQIPATHILNSILPSYFLAISVSENKVTVNSTVLVDTGFFKNSETDDICDLLTVKNVCVKELRDNQFSNFDLDNAVQFYPYDLLFICSHGGSPSGERFKIGFNDSNDCYHTITIDVAHSFEPTNVGKGDNRMINVKTFTEFIELDDQPWYSKHYKPGSSKTVVSDFIMIDRKDWQVLERTKVENMKHCNVIVTQSKMGGYMPMVHSISDPESAPFVFNNSCISNHTLDNSFIFAGASFYVGTIKNVNNLDAVNVAKTFFKKTVEDEHELALSLWQAQQESDLVGGSVYTSTGCHFMKFLFDSSSDSREIVKRRIKADVLRRLRRSRQEGLDDSLKKRHMEAAKYLTVEHELIN